MGFLKDSQLLTPGPPSSVIQITGFRTLQITLKLLQLQVLLVPMGALSPVKTCSGEHFVHGRGSIGNLHLIQHLILTQYHSFGMYVMCVHVQSVSMWLPVHPRT